MKIRTIVGILLVLALVLGSTGIAAAEDQDRDDWDGGYPPSWYVEEDGTGITPGDQDFDGFPGYEM